ncbi:bile acid:sodium symporter family protein [Acidovorax sp. RAC01]|uniref:bile acid:sodium symporter family protein n=1 Tax=Acidovorax sp. RAC01 TaxID=1842533 RepID=UPI00083E7767|nr:bile acid:sodium symporter [Acidovorax sp. RAC01]AOG22807.1 sodium Bile acid symporter family protein [Acidovorax sp. RAC01]
MISETETRLLGIMMIVIMLGMGASLTVKDFLIALRKPVGIGIGVVTTYLLTPMVGFAIAHLVLLPNASAEDSKWYAYAVSLILMACLPGGTTSNIFNYFSKGVLSLSLLMTIVSTLLAVIMVPLTLGLFSIGIEGDWKIPPENVAQVLFVLLVPTAIGMVLRKVNPNLGATLELVGGVLGVVVIVFLVVSWVPRNWPLLLTTPWPVYFGAIGLGVFGFAVGYLFARLVRQDPRRSRTIALETGIQNGPLGVLIVTLTFSGEQQQQVLLIPVLYSLFIVITASIATVFFRRRSEAEALARDRAKDGSVLAR